MKLDAEWAKGWVRVGAASLALHRYTDARESYERALALDEGNEQISKYVKEAKEAEESSLQLENSYSIAVSVSGKQRTRVQPFQQGSECRTKNYYPLTMTHDHCFTVSNRL